MKISDIIEGHKRSKKNLFSFEFFPPKTEKGFDHLIKTAYRLKELQPGFVSITYGAGGGTRKKTRELTVKFQSEIGLVSMAHLTCVGSARNEIYNVLKEYQGEGIQNILPLRGDPPQGQSTFVPPKDGFTYASELVQFIREKFNNNFDLGVAGYPEKHKEAPSMERDIENLKRKVDSGAGFIITQLFLDNEYFFQFLERARNAAIKVPILAGIMPITDFNQVEKFSEIAGTKFPRPLIEELEKAQSNPDDIKRIGIEWATKQCRQLIERGVEGIHFYTLNKSLPTLQIFEKLKD